MNNILLIFVIFIILVGLAISCIVGLVAPQRAFLKFKSWARLKILLVTSITSILVIIIGLFIGVIINTNNGDSEIAKVETTKTNKASIKQEKDEANRTTQDSYIDNTNITRTHYEKFASLELGDDFDFVTNLFGAQPVVQSILPLKDTLSENVFEFNDLKFSIICKNNKIISKELQGWDYSQFEQSEEILEREKKIRAGMSYEEVALLLGSAGFILSESKIKDDTHKKLVLWPVKNNKSFEVYFENNKVRFSDDEMTSPQMYILFAPNVKVLN